MAFSQLFPLKDTTIYSLDPSLNAGMDSIIELTKPNGTNAARILVQFDQNEIKDVVENKITPTLTSGSYNAFLKIYASEVDSLPTSLTLLVDPIANDWDMGTGRTSNDPITEDGASWSGPKVGTFWTTSSNSTSSYIPNSVGGGSWVTGSSSTQSVSTYTGQDIYVDVTQHIKDFYNEVIPNYGHILRVTESIESNPDYVYHLSYFSRDTNTIYPPSLLLYWNDQEYTPNTSSILGDEQFDISLGNNGGVFFPEEVVKFNVYARERYPKRTFVTSSLYEYNKTLPSSSWFQIVDVDTNDVIIPYSTEGTLISSNVSGSYFKVDMSTLEPERYYNIQIKTMLGGQTYIKNNSNMIFKVSQKVGP